MLNRYIQKAVDVLQNVQKSDWYISREMNCRMEQLERMYPGCRNIVGINREFRDIHKGRRGFVLGNGPSLNSIDFGRLSEEIVFTVNRLTMHEDFEKLRTNYHIIADLRCFGVGKPCREKGFTEHSLKQIDSLRDKGNPILFVPIQARPVLEGRRLGKGLNIRYWLPMGKYFTDGYRSNDLTKPVPAFWSVISYAILFATYMGLEEIYLLGCDQTSLRDVLDTVLGNSMHEDHAYKGEEESHRVGYKKNFDELGAKYYVNVELQQQIGYEELYYWCREKRIKLYNLSDPTLINVIPRKKFEDVIGIGGSQSGRS